MRKLHSGLQLRIRFLIHSARTECGRSRKCSCVYFNCDRVCFMATTKRLNPPRVFLFSIVFFRFVRLCAAQTFLCENVPQSTQNSSAHQCRPLPVLSDLHQCPYVVFLFLPLVFVLLLLRWRLKTVLRCKQMKAYLPRRERLKKSF